MTTTPNRTSRWRLALLALVILILLVVGLLLDLRNRGLVWQFIWSQTGEENIAGQIRGMAELGGNLLRAPLDTEPLAPIAYTDVPPYGMNVFLQKEVEEAKIRAMLQMIRDAGFVWLRQEFPWEDIEIDGRGQFTDSRNDIDGDGQRDTIDAWAKYDRMVDLVEEYDLRLLVRLSNPPSWSRAENPPTLGGSLAPPDDLQDFVNFASAVAERYQGRIHHYQIWNEPNIYPEWGENFVDPAGYRDMLCQTHDALKAIDPEIVVHSAAIAPTISLDGFLGYQDIIYLQNLYDLGAGECFDVLSAQAYGLFSGPTDRRRRATSVTVARHEAYRDIMVANGDAHKPIWISEAAWNPVLDAPLPPDQIADYERFGTATLDEAARWMPQLYERAAREWPWVGVIHYWFFTRPDPSEMGQSFFYFRMVEPDYQPDKPTFTPLPVYETMKSYIAQTQADPVLYRGIHQAEHWAVEHLGTMSISEDTNAEFGQAVFSSVFQFTAEGTQVAIRYRSDAGVTALVDGTTVELGNPQQFETAIIHSSTLPERHTYRISTARGLTIDSIIVYDRTWEQIGPVLLAVLILGIFALWQIAQAIIRRIA